MSTIDSRIKYPKMDCNFMEASGFYPWQTTIAKSVSSSGIGLHKGDDISFILNPAKENSGIVFVRKDIDADQSERTVKARYDNVSDTNFCTTIENNDGSKVSTIEHLMAALCGSGIDNIEVEIDGDEVPIMDGSSLPFIKLIEEAGIVSLPIKRKFIKILDKISISDGNKICHLEPSKGMDFFVSIDFSDNVIGKQSISFSMQDDGFKDFASNARTFGFMKDVEALRFLGLGLGGSLDNCIVIDNDEVINSEGLRHKDEFVRHKLLDVVGDLFTSGYRIQGKYSGYLCGHYTNNLLLKELFANKDSYEIIELGDNHNLNIERDVDVA